MQLKWYAVTGIPIFLIGFLVFWTNPNPKTTGTTTYFDRNGELLYEEAGAIGSQRTVNVTQMPQHLLDAVIVTEDEDFYSHYGFNLRAMLRALFQNTKAGQIVSGASTIDQQVARFTVISPYQPAQTTVLRKIREVLIAARLNIQFTKDQILERYLNTMYFGRNVYGVESASRLYFGSATENLSLSQASLLAAMIANPSAYDPITHPQEALQRRNAILSKLMQKGYISQETYDRAYTEPIPTQLIYRSFFLPHAVEMAKAELQTLDLDFSKSLRVYLTVDKSLSEFAQRVSLYTIESLKTQHNVNNAAVVAIENGTGKIVILSGSVGYEDSAIEGQNNMAIAFRQPGSALKPLTYAIAFQHKLATPATVIEDVPKVYLTHDGHGFAPQNYDGRFHGPVMVREALASSYNLPAVEMLDRIGIDSFLDYAHRLGVTGMRETDRYGLALTLGGGEVSLLELTNIYASFGRGGKTLPYHLIERIEDDSGKPLYQHDQVQTVKVFDPEVAYLITDILSDPKARIPTFGGKNPLALSRQTAVKTGTTTDWHDNWTVGYTPQFSVGVWVGNADNAPMREISGVTGAAPIWNQIFEELLRTAPEADFEKPETIRELYICSWDGLLPGEACREHYLEKFIAGTEPTQVSTLTEKPSTVLPGHQLQITNPRAAAVFEIEAVQREAISLEVSDPASIATIQWFIDGTEVESCTHTAVTCLWKPTLGPHTVTASVHTSLDQAVSLGPVPFTVRAYKQGYEN